MAMMCVLGAGRGAKRQKPIREFTGGQLKKQASDILTRLPDMVVDNVLGVPEAIDGGG